MKYIKVKPKEWFLENCEFILNDGITYNNQILTQDITPYYSKYIGVEDNEYMFINNISHNYFYSEWIKDTNYPEYTEAEFKELYPEEFI